MKLYTTLPLVLLLVGCANTKPDYDPFLDEKISQRESCQADLKILVENDAFTETKALVDKHCNIIINRGWVKGNINERYKKRCKASFYYLMQRPTLGRVAKRFIMKECYPENPDKFYWKNALSEKNDG